MEHIGLEKPSQRVHSKETRQDKTRLADLRASGWPRTKENNEVNKQFLALSAFALCV